MVELHSDVKELQQDVLWGLIPLDEPVRTKQHHIACMTQLVCMSHLHSVQASMTQAQLVCFGVLTLRTMQQRHCIRVCSLRNVVIRICLYAVTSVRQRADRYVPSHTNGGLADELELLVGPATSQHLLQFGCCEEELEVHFSVGVILLVLLDGNVQMLSCQQVYTAEGCRQDSLCQIVVVS